MNVEIVLLTDKWNTANEKAKQIEKALNKAGIEYCNINVVE